VLREEDNIDSYGEEEKMGCCLFLVEGITGYFTYPVIKSSK
jgi:hypothetical protein